MNKKQTTPKNDSKTVTGKLPERGYIDQAPPQKEARPEGPFELREKACEGSLLIFTPRNPISVLINELSGGYGYSHLAVDCGEVDVPTGKGVMIEATVGAGVHYAFQDEYGKRRFARIPLGHAGIDVSQFCDGVRSKLGEAYDDQEALTLGVIDDPAKQICSDLATVCLPQSVLQDMAKAYNLGQFHPASTRVYGQAGQGLRLFVSPNGFAEYFGAPRGEQLKAPDQLIEPSLPSESSPVRRYPAFWKIGAAVAGSLALAWLAFLVWRNKLTAHTQDKLRRSHAHSQRGQFFPKIN